MSSADVVSLILALIILGAVVVAANFADQRRNAQLRRGVFASLLLINALLVLIYGIGPLSMAYLSPDDPGAPQKTEAWAGLLLALLTGGLGTALLIGQVRCRIAFLFPRRNVPTQINASPTEAPRAFLQTDPGSTPLFPQMLNYYTEQMRPPFTQVRPGDDRAYGPSQEEPTRGFSPDSTVHAVAMILCVYFLGVQMIGFVLGGGMAGMAEVYEGGLTVWELVINALPFVILAGLGVGLGIRRDWRQAFQRLGLVWPGGKAVLVTLGVVLALFIYVILVTMVWMGAVSEETYKKQTEASEALSESVSTLGLAFALAATAAVGEEIAYRGALQPVFGLWPTAIAFALTHAQYTLTPAWLIILGVAVAFGWLRQQYGTGAAMLAHFVYNFIPLAIATGVSEEALLMLARLVL